MIDPSLFTVKRLLAALLDDHCGNKDRWRNLAEIIPRWMPPCPQKNTQPKCIVRYRLNCNEDWLYLRYSKGPAQGHGWDTYGDDYQTPELALLALLEAPVPPSSLKREVWDIIREERSAMLKSPS